VANMREIRERIVSVQQILKITNAMYLMASSKLKKARKAHDNTKPYFEKLQETLEDILEHTPHTRQTYFDRRSYIPEDQRKKGFIIITADKGLCGSYNHNILKLAEQELKKAFVNNCYIFVLGEVGRHYFMRRNNEIDHSTIDGEFLYTTQNPTLYRAREIAEIVLARFQEKQLDEVYLIFTYMKGNELVPKTVRLFLPSPEEVMNYLIPNYAKGLLYGAMVEAFCCEQQARMTAMDAATSSAKDMIKDLSMMYNRARQAAITQEISEIAGGASALEEQN